MENSQIPEDDQDREAVPDSAASEVDAPEPVSENASPEEETPKKPGIFRWKAIIALVILAIGFAVFNALFLDSTLRQSIGFFGRTLTDTKTEVKTLAASMLDLSVDAQDFYLVDPEALETNLIAADTFEFKVETAPLLEKKVYIKTIKLEGLRWNTERDPAEVAADREAAAARALAPEEEEESEPEAEEGDGPDLAAILDRAAERIIIPRDQLKAVKMLETSGAELSALVPAYTKEITALDINKRSQQAIADIQACAGLTKVKKADLLDRKKVKKIKKDVDKLNAAVKELKKLEKEAQSVSGRMQKDMGTYQARAKELPALKEQDLALIKAKYALDKVPEAEVAQVLFGGSTGKMVSTYLPYVRKVAKLFPPKEAKAAAEKALDGITVEFGRENDLPGVLIEEISFSGEKNGIKVAGKVEGITSNPRLYGKPSRLHISCSKPAFSIDAEIDRTTEQSKDTYTIKVKGLDPGALLPKGGSMFPFQFAAGTLNINADINRIDGRTEFDFKASVNGAKLEGKAETKLQQLIKQAIEDTPEITLEISRRSGQPLRIRSNVDALLNDAVKKELEQIVARKQAEAQQEIDRITGEAAQTYQKQLAAQQQALQAVTARQTAELAKARAEADRIKSKLKKKTGGLLKL